MILTNTDPISLSLADRLKQYNYEYVFVVAVLQRANELYDMNYKVVIGELDEPDTYKNLRIKQASLLVVNNNDMVNITFTVRSLSGDIPIIATANSDDSVDIL